MLNRSLAVELDIATSSPKEMHILVNVLSQSQIRQQESAESLVEYSIFHPGLVSVAALTDSSVCIPDNNGTVTF